MRISHRIGIIALMILPLLGIGVMAAAEEYVVVPGAYVSAEGGSNNSQPFNKSGFQQYQQIYLSDGFARIGKKLLITQIAFRPNGVDYLQGYPFDGVSLPNVQIKLSATQAVPGSLVADFNANFGPEVTVVYSGSLSLSSAYTGAGPKDFDIIIDLQTPFPYDTTQGNLLMYVSKGAPSPLTTPFDAASDLVAGAGTGGETSRVFIKTILVDKVNKIYKDVTFTENSGLVTRFTVRPTEVVIPVAADLKPGNEANKVNAKSRGTLPVAIFGAAEFEVKSINLTTLTVGGVPVKTKPNGQPMASIDDINGDGYLDLMVHVDTEALLAGVGAKTASTSEGGSSTVEASLEGQTLDQPPKTVKGTVSIKIIK